MLEFDRAGIEFLLQTRRQSAIADELLLQTRRQLIFLGESRREMGFALVIPTTKIFFVRIVVARITVVIVIAVVFVVAVSVAIAVAVAMTIAITVALRVRGGSTSKKNA